MSSLLKLMMMLLHSKFREYSMVYIYMNIYRQNLSRFIDSSIHQSPTPPGQSHSHSHLRQISITIPANYLQQQQRNVSYFFFTSNCSSRTCHPPRNYLRQSRRLPARNQPAGGVPAAIQTAKRCAERPRSAPAEPTGLPSPRPACSPRRMSWALVEYAAGISVDGF